MYVGMYTYEPCACEDGHCQNSSNAVLLKWVPMCTLHESTQLKTGKEYTNFTLRYLWDY